MAKAAARTTEPGSIEERVTAFAEQVGWIAGFASAKTGQMLDRARLTEQLTRIRDDAAALLLRLQAETAPVPTESSDPRNADVNVRAPGKRHRAPQPRQRGVKHSRQEIAKVKMASTVRRRGRG